jgi:hypothetical protein
MVLLLKPFSIAKRFQTSKNALWSNMGRCPIPHPLFEKSGAKTFMSASPGISFSMAISFPKSVSFLV